MTGGLLFYGILVGRQNEQFNELLRSHYDDWKDAIADRLGIEVPDLLINSKTKRVLQQYERERDLAVAKLGCIVDQAMQQESGEYYIAIAETVYTGTRSKVAAIPTFAVKPKWKRQFEKVCGLLHVAYQEPGWFLTYYSDG